MLTQLEAAMEENLTLSKTVETLKGDVNKTSAENTELREKIRNRSEAEVDLHSFLFSKGRNANELFLNRRNKPS